jgi:AcrR family transcriptional regulator
MTVSRKQRLTRQEQKARTRQQILASGERVFRRNGFHKATVEMITADAGYTKGAFYANFSSKEDLFFILLAPRLEARGRAIGKLVESEEIYDDASEAAHRLITYMADDPDWQRAFLEFLVRLSIDARFGARLQEVRQPICQALAHLAQMRWGLSPTEANVVATTVWVVSIGSAMEALQSGPEAASTALQLALQSLLNHLSRPEQGAERR